MEEVWMKLPYLSPNIEVSNTGKVREWINHKECREMKGTISSNKRFISSYGKQYSVHRLVADAFLPVDDPKLDIIVFKDGDSLNCKVSNLVRANRSEALSEAYKNGTSSRKKIYCEELKKAFTSVKGASYLTSVPADLITESIRREKKVCGLSFKYVSGAIDEADDCEVVYSDTESALQIAFSASSVEEFRNKMQDKFFQK